jgi:hypothetical protein
VCWCRERDLPLTGDASLEPRCEVLRQPIGLNVLVTTCSTRSLTIISRVADEASIQSAPHPVPRPVLGPINVEIVPGEPESTAQAASQRRFPRNGIENA